MEPYALYFLLTFPGPQSPEKINLHLTPIENRRSQSLDLKLVLNNRGYFYGQIDNFTTVKLQARFVFPVKGFGKIGLTFKLPPALDFKTLNIRL